MSFGTLIRRSLSLTVMLGILTIACGVLVAITLVQSRETRTVLASVQAEEGRQLATTLAASIAALAGAQDTLLSLERGMLERLIASVAGRAEVAEVAVVDREGTIVARHGSGSAPNVATLTARSTQVFETGSATVERTGDLLTFVEPVRRRPASADGESRVIAALHLRAAPTAITGAVADRAWRMGLLRLARTFDAMAERITADDRRLRAGEARYREVVESAGDGIFTADEHGTFLDVNPSGCSLVQRPRDEVVGRPIGDFIHPDEVPEVATTIRRLLAGDTVVREWRMRLPGDVYVRSR